jgi:hypothetical protein
MAEGERGTLEHATHLHRSHRCLISIHVFGKAPDQVRGGVPVAAGQCDEVQRYLCGKESLSSCDDHSRGRQASLLVQIYEWLDACISPDFGRLLGGGSRRHTSG